MKDFKCEASKLAWKNFQATGNICFLALYHNIENVENIKLYSLPEDELER